MIEPNDPDARRGSETGEPESGEDHEPAAGDPSLGAAAQHAPVRDCLARLVMRIVIRRNAGGPGCLPPALLFLSVVWIGIGVFTLPRAPSPFGAVAMLFLGTLFVLAAVIIQVRAWRRGGFLMRRHELVRIVSGRANDTIVWYFRERRETGRGHRRDVLRIFDERRRSWSLYPATLELRMIERFLMRRYPRARRGYAQSWMTEFSNGVEG